MVTDSTGNTMHVLPIKHSEANASEILVNLEKYMSHQQINVWNLSPHIPVVKGSGNMKIYLRVCSLNCISGTPYGTHQYYYTHTHAPPHTHTSNRKMSD